MIDDDPVYIGAILNLASSIFILSNAHLNSLNVCACTTTQQAGNNTKCMDMREAAREHEKSEAYELISARMNWYIVAKRLQLTYKNL
jgi:hypothetical protein